MSSIARGWTHFTISDIWAHNPCQAGRLPSRRLP
jgi:hypothetical protein